MMRKNSKIYISGHSGMFGSAFLKLLEEKGYRNLIYRDEKELDLREQARVDRFMRRVRPEYVFLLAAKVGGIKANIGAPAEFLYDNLMIEANVINASFKHKVKKLLFLGSSCIYPRECPQPMKEEYLLTGGFEPTNEGYALAKVMGIKLCEYYNRQFKTNYICLIPPNLYGPRDNFDLKSGHVLAALIRKFHEAKIKGLSAVTVWGSGKPKREFLFVDDLADACLYFMCHYDKNGIINVGTGEDLSIRELAFLVKEIIGFAGRIIFDPSQPDGMPRKLLDISRQKKYGWRSTTKLSAGIKEAYKGYLKNNG